MSASTMILPNKHSRSLSQLINIYRKEAVYEFLKYIRIPLYAVSAILFPLMFYILFGLLMGRQNSIGSVGMSTYLIATYGTFGVMGASLYSNGAGVAVERGLGWIQVKRASPMPAFAYFFAKIIVSMIFGAIVVALLLALGMVLGGVHIATGTAIELIATLVIGAVPFCAMGLVIGYFAGPNSAPAAVNLIYLPLSFASGLWFPIEALPKFLQHLAVVLPPYHLAQLALHLVGASRAGSMLGHWEYLFGFTLLCLGLARIGFQRDEGKMYG